MTNISNFRNNWINIDEIYGVNVLTGEVNDHPDFPNPKSSIRENIIDDLMACDNADDVPPIEIWVNPDGGTIICIDGKHRLTSFARKCSANPESDKFNRIKCCRFNGTKEDAIFRAIKVNLNAARSNLNEAEEMAAINMLLDRGYDAHAIAKRLGRTSPYFVNNIIAIGNSSPVLANAVNDGHIEIQTAAHIAKKVGLPEQAEMVEKVKEVKKSGKSESEARVELGLRQGKRSILKLSEIENLIGDNYSPDYQFMVKNQTVDPYTHGFISALTAVLKLDELSSAEMYMELDKIYNTQMMNDQIAEQKQRDKLKEESKKKKTDKTAIVV